MGFNIALKLPHRGDPKMHDDTCRRMKERLEEEFPILRPLDVSIANGTLDLSCTLIGVSYTRASLEIGDLAHELYRGYGLSVQQASFSQLTP